MHLKNCCCEIFKELITSDFFLGFFFKKINKISVNSFGQHKEVHVINKCQANRRTQFFSKMKKRIFLSQRVKNLKNDQFVKPLMFHLKLIQVPPMSTLMTQFWSLIFRTLPFSIFTSKCSNLVLEHKKHL